MKKSKKPLVGGILLGVGALGIVGIPAADKKLYLILGVLALFAAGVVLLIIGIKQNKAILEVTYNEFDNCYVISADYSDEFKLPKIAEEFANKFYAIPVEVGKNCESLIFYK